MTSQNWTDSVKATFNACLCSNTASESDDERDRQQGGASSSTGTAATGGRHIFARDELEGLLASASSDEDADAMSLHSNVGGSGRSKRKKGRGKGKQKRRDAWGVVRRNLSIDSRRSMQMFGWYPFGRPIALPESSDEEDDGQREGRRTRTLSTATHDSDAAPLDSSDIVSRVTEEEQRKKNLELMRANFEPEMTNEDLEREERDLAEQEEAAAVSAFSFPAVPPKSPVEPPAEPEPEVPSIQGPEPAEEEQEEEEGAQPPPSVADDQTFITDDTPATESSSPTLPRTPLSPPPFTPSSPTKSSQPSTPAATATSTPLTHAERIKKAAKEQRRRMREEAARRKKEEIERRAEAAAGGFGFDEHHEQQQQQQEFGEFVVGEHDGAGVAWTESDGVSSHPGQQQPPPLPAMYIPDAPMHGLPLHHQIRPDEHPLSPSDDELMDYGAEYAASRRSRKTTVFGGGSASGSDRLERMSNGSGGAGRVRPNMVPLPPSNFGSPRKPTILHRNTGSGTLSSHSGLSGQGGQVYYQPVAPVQLQAPIHAEPMEFEGVPGGLDDLHASPSAGIVHHQGEYVLAPAEYNPQFQPAQEFDGIPGGLNSRHTRSRAGSVMDLGSPAAKHSVPKRSNTSSIDSVGMGMSGGGGFPSTGFGSSIGAAGRPRAGSRARTLESGVAAAMLGRNAE